MAKLVVSEDVYKDKVYGCWLGKNIGGTLGQPLEKRFGQQEMFDVWWYPDLPEDGIPNDDLELQLIWLQALKEKGPGIDARDLAEYWLDSVSYNFDEYGLHKTNLMRGLRPPVSGWHNNWFIHCMGSPIRSEIWATVAPGAPHIAAHYAFQDAIVDHAGGESVYGEVFNAVVQSAAFVMEDKFKLIDIGLSAIPSTSETYGAISAVLDLHKQGVEWKSARETIKDKFYNPIAQYSPINLAFQTIGWLYGRDFADAICKAVNCGWDTDCTGATLGATLGIILGGKNLPEKWVKPLGDEVTTNVSTGGIKNLKAPTNLHDLTEEVYAMAKRVLNYWQADVEFGDRPYGDPVYTFTTDWLTDYKPNSMAFDLDTIRAELIYDDGPAVVGDAPTNFTFVLENPRPEMIAATIDMDLPCDWQVSEPLPVTLNIPPGTKAAYSFCLRAPQDNIQLTNQGTIKVDVPGRPALKRIPLVFLGGFRYFISPFYRDISLDDPAPIEEGAIFTKMPTGWKEIWRRTNDLELGSLFDGDDGVVYIAHYIHAGEPKPSFFGVPNTNRMQLFLNGNLLHTTEKVVPLAPNEGGDGSNYVKAELTKGWNQVLIKLEKGEKPLTAHFLASGIDEKYPINIGHALMGIERASLPW